MRESKKSGNRNIFVYIFPVNANAVSNKLPSLPLFVCGTVKAWKPFERCADFASVRKADMNAFLIKVNACC